MLNATSITWSWPTSKPANLDLVKQREKKEHQHATGNVDLAPVVRELYAKRITSVKPKISHHFLGVRRWHGTHASCSANRGWAKQKKSSHLERCATRPRVRIYANTLPIVRVIILGGGQVTWRRTWFETWHGDNKENWPNRGPWHVLLGNEQLQTEWRWKGRSGVVNIRSEGVKMGRNKKAIFRFRCCAPSCSGLWWVSWCGKFWGNFSNDLRLRREAC